MEEFDNEGANYRESLGSGREQCHTKVGRRNTLILS